jgi:hypothetical protein
VPLRKAFVVPGRSTADADPMLAPGVSLLVK